MCNDLTAVTVLFLQRRFHHPILQHLIPTRLHRRYVPRFLRALLLLLGAAALSIFLLQQGQRVLVHLRLFGRAANFDRARLSDVLFVADGAFVANDQLIVHYLLLLILRLRVYLADGDGALLQEGMLGAGNVLLFDRVSGRGGALAR